MHGKLLSNHKTEDITKYKQEKRDRESQRIRSSEHGNSGNVKGCRKCFKVVCIDCLVEDMKCYEDGKIHIEM